MFTTKSLFDTLFNSVPTGWTPPKPKPKIVLPKPKPTPKQEFSLYTFHIEDYHTHF